MSIVDSFDAQSSAVFSPCDVYRPLEGFPEIALIAFNRRMVDFAAGQPGAREITKLHYAVYEIPVYALKWQGRDIAVCVSFEGSGGAAMVMEELIALGARTFLAIGSCGCLDAGIAEGHCQQDGQQYKIKNQGCFHRTPFPYPPPGLSGHRRPVFSRKKRTAAGYTPPGR